MKIPSNTKYSKNLEQSYISGGEGARSGRPGGGSVRAKGTGGRSAGESGGRSEMGMGATESPREEGNAWRLGLGECEFVFCFVLIFLIL